MESSWRAISRGRPFFTLFALVLTATLLINGCVLGQKNDLKTLRIGLNNWIGYDVVLYAQETGLFKKRGLDVKLVRFENPQDATRAMLRGSLDATFTTLWDAMQADQGNDNPALILVTDVSHGADGIVAKPGIQAVKELREKRIGAKLATINHLILLEALQANQIEPDQIQIEDVSNETAVQLLEQGQLDAAVVWEPLLSEVAENIQGKVIYTTRETDSLVIDGLVSRSSMLKSKQTELKQFMLAWFDLMQAIETNPDDVFTVVGQQLQINSTDLSSDYAGLKKGDIALNQRMFQPQGRLQAASQEMARLLQADPRHGRTVREDVGIETELMMAVAEEWEA
jgi:NitT/TauT family transport system substrate-binding protein